MSAAPLSEMRYQCLHTELGNLLAQLRTLGASYEDLLRSSKLIESVCPSTIGAVIHDLQTQIYGLQQFNDANGINPDCFADYEEELYGH